MAQEVVEVERALLALAPRERAAVVHAALISLDGGAAEGSQEDVDTAWCEEAGSRLDDVLDGAVELGSFEATQARFTAQYPPTA